MLPPSLRLHWPLFFRHSPLPSCFGFVADSQAGADGLTFSGKTLCVDSSWASLGASCSVFAPEGRLCRSQAPWHGRSAASVPSWDKIPILSFVESSMTRLESCPTIRSWLTSGVGSPLSPSPQPPDVTSHLSSGICHLPSVIRHPPFAICHPASAICHPPFAIRHLPSAIPPSPFPGRSKGDIAECH